jgi:hypothetical protein
LTAASHSALSQVRVTFLRDAKSNTVPGETWAKAYKPPGRDYSIDKTLKFEADTYTCAVDISIVDANFDELKTAAKTLELQRQNGSIHWQAALPSDAVAAFDALRKSGFRFDKFHTPMLEALEKAHDRVEQACPGVAVDGVALDGSAVDGVAVDGVAVDDDTVWI